MEELLGSDWPTAVWGPFPSLTEMGRLSLNGVVPFLGEAWGCQSEESPLSTAALKRASWACLFLSALDCGRCLTIVSNSCLCGLPETMPELVIVNQTNLMSSVAFGQCVVITVTEMKLKKYCLSISHCQAVFLHLKAFPSPLGQGPSQSVSRSRAVMKRDFCFFRLH